MRYNDEVEILFNSEDAAPYALFGKYRSQDEEYVRIIGTHGDSTNKEVFVPKRNIKMITVLQRARD
ncbi:MAG TPA: hypothetical protein VGE97_09390 [Nitrososphaera sp.]